jgi:hypothetical protein
MEDKGASKVKSIFPTAAKVPAFVAVLVLGWSMSFFALLFVVSVRPKSFG